MKAKPVKGSAKAKKFDRGGTVAALAGLGTLAYLLGKKKDGDKTSTAEEPKAAEKPAAAEPPELKKLGKFPSESGDETSKGDTNTKAYEPIKKETSGGIRKRSDIGRIGSMDAGIPKQKNDYASRPKEPKEEKQDIGKIGSMDAGIPKQKNDYASRPKEAKEAKEETAKIGSMDTAISKAKQNFGKGATNLPGKGSEKKEDIGKSAAKLPGSVKGAEKDEEKKYGIGPYGAFSSVHKAVSENFKTPAEARAEQRRKEQGKKSGGAIKKYAAGGSVSSASKRADGIAVRGKTKCRMV
jgi:hypothetical protein